MLFHTLLLAGTASASCLHGLSKFKRQEGGEGGVPISQFGYTGLIGPLNWASLGPENEACKTGKQQSPINIDQSVSLATERPVVTIEQQPVEFENLGSTVEVIVNGTTSFAGNDFRLKQFHVHTPSEHRVGEEFFPMEAHFVHEGVTDPNQIAVISVLFQMSANETSTPFISGLRPHLAAISTPGTKTAIESGLDFASMINHVQTTELFQYTGSLTTPPCAEGLTFLVTKNPLPLDVDTFNDIKRVVKFNSRYTQNTLGEENLIGVAMVAGTEQQFTPPPVLSPGQGQEQEQEQAAGGEEQPTPSAGAGVREGEGGAAQITSGATVVISEIAGMPTSLLAVIA
ncbi:carbonic anhydrase [Westerdykella ornata]|uniref:Carbonic anhydrase n=1 Tax=Westerdykella ornata TaxID=318751 RepID=A0A6A6JEY3_WESOR|nr:carbonic anhydrase [Westerdykella ornata]KAF2273739.1 carbonic anhydrase [Westerdykella ornata]